MLFCLSYLAYGQWRMPVDSPMHLSGNFAALRSDHFHFGLDIPTNDTIGWPVYSVERGFVSRIYISSSGYGLAVFVTHPNGYTSVFAHLSSFSEKVTQWVRKRQYQLKKNEVDLFPPENLISVSKGEVIAFSGNSGGSSGPHLHFEIRRSKDNLLVDPQAVGFLAPDTVIPFIDSVRFLPVLRGKTHFKNPVYSILDQVELPEGNYVPEALIYDVSSFLQNKLAPHSFKCYLNNEIVSHCTYQLFGFHHSASVIYHYNYPWYFHTGNKFTLLTKTAQLSAPFFNFSHEGIYIKSGIKYEFKIEVEDIHGKKNWRIITIKGIEKKVSEDNSVNVRFKIDTTLESGSCALWVGKGTVTWGSSPTVQYHQGDIYAISGSEFPFLKAAALGVSGPIRKSAALRSTSGAWIISTHFKDEKTWFPIWRSGEYRLDYDTIAPQIKVLQGFTNNKGILLQIIDEQPTGNGSGISYYEARLNGKWTLASWDAKNEILTTLHDNPNPEGVLSIMVKDKLGNWAEKKVEIHP